MPVLNYRLAREKGLPEIAPWFTPPRLAAAQEVYVCVTDFMRFRGGEAGTGLLGCERLAREQKRE